jgi:hypothetical protein
MREVDCLSLVFIEFYVSVLTTRLDCIKTALQLSEISTSYYIYHIYFAIYISYSISSLITLHFQPLTILLCTFCSRDLLLFIFTFPYRRRHPFTFLSLAHFPSEFFIFHITQFRFIFFKSLYISKEMFRPLTGQITCDS